MTASMPSFIIAGAMRSGTTSMTRWLDEHPDVYMATPKEVHYFDRNYERGLVWYQQHFAGATSERAVGEATPNYLYDEQALRRLAVDIPGVSLIVLLRDPVERAYSHYQHRVSRGGEQLSFEHALAAEEERLTQGALDRAHFSYADRGHYLEQLQRLLRLFPRESVLVELFEDLRDDPVRTFQRTAAFLGIDASHVPAGVGRQINSYQSFRSHSLRRFGRRLPPKAAKLVGKLNRVHKNGYEPIPAEAQARLVAAYEPERDELARLVDLDLSCWRR